MANAIVIRIAFADIVTITVNLYVDKKQFRKAYCGPLPPSYHVDQALMQLPPTKVCFVSLRCV